MLNKELLLNFLIILAIIMWFVVGFAAGFIATNKHKIAIGDKQVIDRTSTAQIQELQGKLGATQVIYVEGEGVFIINDLMHEQKINQINISYFSTTKAKAFGVQHTRIILLD